MAVKLMDQVRSRLETPKLKIVKDKTTRKQVDKEKHIVPILNDINSSLLRLGSLERGYKGISTFGIKEAKILGYKFKKIVENNILGNSKTTKECKQILKIYKEDKLYSCSLFKNVG